MTPRPRVVLAADWGGHRVSVMKHIDAALNELNLAVPCIRAAVCDRDDRSAESREAMETRKGSGSKEHPSPPDSRHQHSAREHPYCRADAYAYSNRGICYAAPVLGEMSRQKSAVSCGHHLRVA
jgi:hypothetical protein